MLVMLKTQQYHELYKAQDECKSRLKHSKIMNYTERKMNVSHTLNTEISWIIQSARWM